MFKLAYHLRAIKFLQKLSKKEKKTIIRRLEILREDPYTKKLDIKKLATRKKSFRMRTGKIRVIYELHLKQKIIYIRNIDFRSGVY